MPESLPQFQAKLRVRSFTVGSNSAVRICTAGRVAKELLKALTFRSGSLTGA